MDKLPSQHRGDREAETEVSLGVSRAQCWSSTPAGGAEAQNPRGDRKEGEAASGLCSSQARALRQFQRTRAWALEPHCLGPDSGPSTADSGPIPPTTAGCGVQLNLHKRQCPPVSGILLAPTSGWKDLRELGAQHSAQSLACRKCSRCAGHHDSFTPTGTHGQPEQLGLGFASVSGNTGLWCPHFPLFCV